MSRVRISKEFRWEMGHRIPYHTGGCANIHGHSYRLVVEVVGGLDEGGMVADYGTISAAVKPIVQELDHSYMVDPTDHLMQGVLEESGLKKFEVPFHTTAENIALWLLDKIKSALPLSNADELVVRVHETHSTMAEASWRR